MEANVGEHKVPTMTRLGAGNRAWVEKQAPLFGGVSSFLDLLVTVVRGLIAAGSLKWEIPALQALLRNSCNDVEQEGLTGRVALEESARPDPAPSPRRVSVPSRLRRTSLGSEAESSRITPFRFVFAGSVAR